MSENTEQVIERLVDEGKLETVAQTIGDKPQSPPDSEAFLPPTVDNYPTPLPAVGIHFGVPDSVYHSWPALSASGIRKLAASPTLFYMTTPWLHPAEEEEEEKAWATIGKAYHARILEGKAAFDERYCIKLEKSAVEGLCCTIDDIKKRLDEVHGVLPKGTRKDDFVNQLLAIEPDAPIWEKVQERYEEANGGRTQLAYEIVERIEIAAAMIERHEELSQALSGGYPEVSLFWYCPKTGVPMKARADYLKLKLIVDLKSYENKLSLSPEAATRKAIANNRYALQPSVYFEAVNEVRAIVREHGRAAIFVGEENLQSTPEVDWAIKWAAREEEPEWLWCFQQKGVAPITRGIFYPKGGTTRMLYDEMVSRMKKRFRQFATTFGTDTWLDIAPIDDTFSDEDIPPWSTDI
jgi:hypothetical protein